MDKMTTEDGQIRPEDEYSTAFDEAASGAALPGEAAQDDEDDEDDGFAAAWNEATAADKEQ